MDHSENRKQAVVEVGPYGKSYAKIFVSEKRQNQKDRRKIYTYIADDLRKGVADRRRYRTQHPHFRRRELEDRRQTNTYIADDRRSGIADRRNRKRFLPPWWQVIVSPFY